jgi:hypothetical protein
MDFLKTSPAHFSKSHLMPGNGADLLAEGIDHLT